MTANPQTPRRILAATLAAAGTAAVLTGAPSPAAAALQVDPCVQKIAVVNNAAFVASFVVSTRVGITSAPTDQYAINNWRIVDLTSTPITPGDDVRPVVSANSGGTVPGNNYVSFCANGQTATYSVTGTTTNFQVTLLT